MTKYFGFLILVFSFFVQSFAEDIIVKDGEIKIIGKNISYLNDHNREFEVNDVIGKLFNGEFIQNDNSVFTTQDVVGYAWFSFTLTSQIDEEVWLSMHNCNIDSLYFYKLNLKGEILSSQLMGAALGRDKSYNSFFPYWMQLTEENQTEKFIYLFRGSGTGIGEYPIEIGSKESLYLSKTHSDSLKLLFMGGMILIFFYNLSLYTFIKERVYIYYSGYIFYVCIMATYVNYFPFTEVVYGSYFTSQFPGLMVVPAAIFIGLTTLSFLSMTDRLPKLYSVLKIELIIAIVFTIISPFIPNPFLILFTQFISLVLFATCVVSSVHLARKGDRSALLYSIGWGLMLTGTILQVLILNGIIDIDFSLRGLIIFFVFGEVLIFSIALSSKINTLKLEQNRLNKNLELVNDELQKSNDSLDSFNYHVSHDLKTVLNNTISLSMLIRKYTDQKNFDKLNEITPKLLKVAANGKETVETFLSLGQVDSFMNESSMEKVNISWLCKEILSIYNLEEQLEINIVKDEIKTLHIHEKALESILLNFFTNTIKYNTSEKPTGELTLLDEDNEVVLIYKDNGIGIEQKNIKNLFKPFVRIKNSLNKEGSGIGLYVVSRIIINYRGTINVESELGQGIKFTIRLPKQLKK